MASSEIKDIVTRDRILQRIIFEVLSSKCNDLTFAKIHDIARWISSAYSNTMIKVKRDGFSLTDEEANDINFWIGKIIR